MFANGQAMISAWNDSLESFRQRNQPYLVILVSFKLFSHAEL